ncbi:MAG: aldehyde dehydrogenase family protein [Acidobacteriaceae bacterium]
MERATGGRCGRRVDAGRVVSRAVQQHWSATPIRARLKILKRARHRMAGMSERFVAAISPALARTPADTLVAELLPLLDACRFLELNAARILQTRVLGSAERPLWLRGIAAEIQRDPLGHVLVIGPSNFPLFLPGVQVLQALAAGNSVTWKPGEGGRDVAELVAAALTEAGLPHGLLTVTADSVDAAYQALAERPDKVVFTGSAEAGKDVLTKLAESATPAVMELSGADAVIVLPGANLERVAKAVAFGLRLNGGATCMSPRRLLAIGDTMAALVPLLERELATVPAIALPERTGEMLRGLLDQAVATGASLRGAFEPARQRPLLIASALPTMAIANSDIFAPVLSLITVSTAPKFPDVYAECPYALTVAIFGGESAALALGEKLRAGTVLINDLIAPTADPRVPFGGRGASGYGVTRGAEGLLEMTAAKTVIVRRGRSIRHWLPTAAEHVPLFEAMILAAHGRTVMMRLDGLRGLLSAGRKLKI